MTRLSLALAVLLFINSPMLHASCNSADACKVQIKCPDVDSCRENALTEIKKNEMDRRYANDSSSKISLVRSACLSGLAKCRDVAIEQVCLSHGGRDCKPFKEATAPTAAKTGAQAGQKATITSFNNPTLQKYLKNVPQNLR